MFKWLDLLEKEFDRSFVQLDLLLGEVEEENKQVTNEGFFSSNYELFFLRRIQDATNSESSHRASPSCATKLKLWRK